MSDMFTCPEDFFDSPQQVCDQPDLSVGRKIEILERWKANELELVRADSEGMAPGRGETEAPRPGRFIPDIDRAIERLEGSVPS